MPYIVGHPIKNPADFYGRSREVTRFYEIVGGTQAQSVSIRGIRRAGKTSFLQYVSHQEVVAQHLIDPDKYVMIYIDMSFCRSPADFYQRLAARLKDILGQAEDVNLWQSPPGATMMYDVEALLCQFPHKRIILLLDEFDQLHVETFDQMFLVELRALTSVWDYDLACVTASYWDLYHLGERVGLPPTSPFYNIFYPTPIFLPGLKPAESDTLIRIPAWQAGVALNDNDVVNIQQLAGSLPFFLQATAAKWFEEKKAKHAPDPIRVQNQLVADLSPYFVQWWRHFDDCQQDLLRSVAGNSSLEELSCSQLELDEAKGKLRHYGLLLEQEGGLVINGDIFNAWIRRHAGRIVLHGRKGNGTAEVAQDDFDPTALRHALINHFDMEELRTLCFDLGVDFDELPGKGKGAKARDLVVYWQRRGQLDRLAEAIRYERGAVV